MSNTTKTIQEECYGICWGAQQRIDELTQYLNESNQRIKRLEEAGDILSRYLRDIPYASDYLYQSGERSLRINNWTQAKEDKL